MQSRTGSAGMTVVSVAVGRGDATLVRWQPAAGEPFNMLIDGGPKSGHANLVCTLADEGVDFIDVLVLTHCDADHVDGLMQLCGKPDARLEIKQYWGPCLAAFERHTWLFPPRIKRGLDQARRLEDALSAAGVPVLYPLEHFVVSSPDSGLTIRVLSPAARLIKRLLVAADAEDLFLDYPTPLGWLLQPEEPTAEDAFGELRTRVDRQALLSPADVTVIAPLAGTAADRDARARSWAQSSGLDPEFFGNNVLNDTSIVLLLQARCENVVRRLLLTGDVENFCYLAGRYPLGCRAISSRRRITAAARLSVATLRSRGSGSGLRPRAAFVSANGKHGLPRTDFRDASLRWGATLFCTCRRSREIVLGPQQAGSCHKTFACNQQENVRIDVTASGIASEGVACASGTTSVIQPLIQLKQHIVEPSNILARFTENELLGHVEWVRKRLVAHHQDRLAAPANDQAEPISAKTLT
jgi:hypothetical protein